MVGTCVEVAERLDAQGIGVTVVDPRWVKPVNPALVDLAREHRMVVSVEDNGRVGGCGAALTMALRDAGVTTPVQVFGIPQEFLPTAKRATLIERIGLTAQGLAREITAQVSALNGVDTERRARTALSATDRVTAGSTLITRRNAHCRSGHRVIAGSDPPPGGPMSFLRTKSIEQSMQDADDPEYQLKKSLSALDLTVFGIGVIIGAGIFTLTGAAAKEYAGPAVAISFTIAAICCAFAAMCYAEFAAAVPVSGSAYTFSYATLGEMVAWIIGWDLILELMLGASVVAQGWSTYAVELLDQMGITWPENLGPGADFNLLSFLLVAALTVLITVGHQGVDAGQPRAGGDQALRRAVRDRDGHRPDQHVELQRLRAGSDPRR